MEMHPSRIISDNEEGSMRTVNKLYLLMPNPTKFQSECLSLTNISCLSEHISMVQKRFTLMSPFCLHPLKIQLFFSQSSLKWPSSFFLPAVIS